MAITTETLKAIQANIENALDAETTESLTQWLLDKRKARTETLMEVLYSGDANIDNKYALRAQRWLNIIKKRIETMPMCTNGDTPISKKKVLELIK